MKTPRKGVNLNNPARWKQDIVDSVDMYNSWFMKFAPKAYRDTRAQVAKDVEATLLATNNLRDVSVTILKANPAILPTLRMATCPPLAVDRLIGLSGVPDSLVDCMEKTKKLPLRLLGRPLDAALRKVGAVIEKMADPDIFVWLGRETSATEAELHRAATIVADRLCGSIANPIIRNAQEKRQLSAIENWLIARGYHPIAVSTRFDVMPPGTFCFRMNVPVKHGRIKRINIPIDAVVMAKSARPGTLPLFIEAKSAGDFTNVNKRRKEEAVKMSQLRRTYGNDIMYILFLCGYFDSRYLGYEAAEGIDWVWEHRIDELSAFGI